MTLEELKQSIKNKSFVDKFNYPYQFIPENTLRVGLGKSNLINYSLYEENEKFYLQHNQAFGTEDMLLEIESETPLTINLISKSNLKAFATWKEQNNQF